MEIGTEDLSKTLNQIKKGGCKVFVISTEGNRKLTRCDFRNVYLTNFFV